jgi:hypothetical protein
MLDYKMFTLLLTDKLLSCHFTEESAEFSRIDIPLSKTLMVNCWPRTAAGVIAAMMWIVISLGCLELGHCLT